MSVGHFANIHQAHSKVRDAALERAISELLHKVEGFRCRIGTDSWPHDEGRIDRDKPPLILRLGNFPSLLFRFGF